MLRAAFWLSAVVYLPLGLVLYFFPSNLSQLLNLSPLWLARFSGALISAWGLLMVLAPYKPESLTRFALITANLLVVATLVPAVLRGVTGAASPLLLGITAILGVAAVLGIIGGERRA